MTEPIPPKGPAPSARPPRTARGRRRKAAVDSRIAASGIAACAAFGMVLGMGLGQVATEAAANSAAPAASAQPAGNQPRPVARQARPEIVVIQRRYVPVAGGSGSSGSGSGSVSAPVPAPAPAPAPAPPPPPTSSGGS